MEHLIGILFDWPNGIVVGNLIASAICFSIAVFHLDRLAGRHHAAMKAHITAEHEKSRLHISAEHEKTRQAAGKIDP